MRRHKFGFSAAAAVSVALLAGIAATTWGLLKEAAARKTAESATGRAEAETAKAIAANKANKHNLHLASMADFGAAVKALEEDTAATRRGPHAIGFAGKSRWHEGVVLLTRSLEREPENTAAALRLYETLASRQAAKRDWPLHVLNHETDVSTASFSPDGTKVVTAGDKTARIWGAATGLSIGQPMHHGAQGASFSSDGARIVTTGRDNTARIWDATTREPLAGPLRHGYVIFTPDGTKILTASHDHMWKVLPKVESDAVAAITLEILAWARNFSGLHFSENGDLHLIPHEERIAGMTHAALPAGPWADLAKWINTPAPQRAIDLKSRVSLRQIAEQQRDFNGNGAAYSLESALRYDPTVPLARLFLAAALERADAAKEAKDSSISQRAAFLRRYDLDALARETGRVKNGELAALWVRAANHLLELPPETKIGVGPKPSTAREETEKGARKALELVPGLPAADELLKKL